MIPLAKLLKRGSKQCLYLKKNLFKSIYRGIKICVKNLVRIYQARFSQEIKNTEARRNFHHSYEKKKRVSLFCNPTAVTVSNKPSPCTTGQNPHLRSTKSRIHRFF